MKVKIADMIVKGEKHREAMSLEAKKMKSKDLIFLLLQGCYNFAGNAKL